MRPNDKESPSTTGPAPAAPNLRVSLVRPGDLLALELELINLTLLMGPPRLVRILPAQPAYLIVHFPSQHIAEEAFLESEKGSDPLEPPPVDARMAGPSRLVFKVPETVTALDYTVEALLEACRTYELSVAFNAPPPALAQQVTSLQPPVSVPASGPHHFARERRARVRERLRALMGGVPEPGEALLRQQENRRREAIGIKPFPARPRLSETSIEAPFRLILSPNERAAWGHALQPVMSQESGRVELWHTRLGVRTGGGGIDERSPGSRTVRAVWSRDPGFDNVKALPLPDMYEDAPGTDRNPFRMSLDARDRHQIVHLTSNFNPGLLGGGLPADYEPEPIAVERLMLSSLGAWLDTHGTWALLPKDFTLEEWRHRAILGRDQYVRTVDVGFLYPFGHRASKVTITERRFHPERSGHPAWLFQREFIIVREPVRTSASREMPFKIVRILTRVTPVLDPLDSHGVPDSEKKKKSDAFWPAVGGSPFRFQMQAVDHEGRTVELTAPLIFVGGDANKVERVGNNPSRLEEVQAEYRRNETLPLRLIRLEGQGIAYAPSNEPGDTRFETDTVIFDADLLKKEVPPGQPGFFPVMSRATLRIPALQHLLGKTGTSDVVFPEAYGTSGFEEASNPGEVFLALDGTTDLDFDEAGDKSGGLVKPNMRISGLSRRIGLVAGSPERVVSGEFDPEDFFAGLGAKLFGAINLWDIIDGKDGLETAPKFITRTLDPLEQFQEDLTALAELLPRGGGLSAQAEDLSALAAGFPGVLSTPSGQPGFLQSLARALDTCAGLLARDGVPPGLRQELSRKMGRLREAIADAGRFKALAGEAAQARELPEELRTRFEWRPVLKPWGLQQGEWIFDPGTEGCLRISVEVQTKTSGLTSPSFEVSTSFENFDIHLIAPSRFLSIHFNRLHFIIQKGKKPDIDVHLGEIRFEGVLSFVEALKNLIPDDGFSDPPALDVTPRGITASYSQSLPNVAIGMFSLENLSLSAALDLPFIGQPLSLRFGFCERDNPFTLTVAGIGGGGFFGITLTPRGVQLLEAALEFGASLTMDFGVASGGVSIMAGIYFKMEGKPGKPDDVTLTGYLRIRGEVSVLGLISCSIELSMSLSYSSGKVIGRASLLIEVEVLLFSQTVELTCERRFAGSNGDPTFRQVMAPDPGDPTYRPWDEYCQAFAA